jgi:PAS domain S-box-containing protein
LSDLSITQTHSNLEKLGQLVDMLGEAIDWQYRSVVSTTAGDMVPLTNEPMQMMTRIKQSMDKLARGLEIQEKEHHHLLALHRIGAVINSSLDQTEVLNMVMDTIIQLTGAERGFLMLYDSETGELEVEVARNINQETIEKSSFEISRSIVKQVAASGEPVVTTNAQADPRFSNQESIISYNLRSILCAPLKIKENAIGVIYADNRIVSGIFGDTDRDLLAAFANQAAVAIENARLFHQIRDQLANITEMKNLQDNVFGSIASGVITIDTADRISLYNRAAEQMLGFPGEQALERDYRSLLSAQMRTVIELLVDKTKRSGSLYNMEMDTGLGDQTGTSTISLTFSPLRDHQQETMGVAMVLDDISEKKRLESVRRYLPPALVDQVRDVDAAQQPQRRNITVIFADVRGFSTVSEHLEPEILIEIVNGYLTVAVQAINTYEGMIDKYDGDAVMAIFNTRLNPHENHVERAVRAAVDMRADLAAYHETVPEDQRLHFGIGIHTGDAVVGNVGSPFRKDYSAIGDAVNLAKRLQEMARPDQILLSDNAYQQVQELAEAVKLGPVRIKGRQAQEQIYELTGLK